MPQSTQTWESCQFYSRFMRYFRSRVFSLANSGARNANLSTKIDSFPVAKLFYDLETWKRLYEEVIKVNEVHRIFCMYMKYMKLHSKTLSGKCKKKCRWAMMPSGGCFRDNSSNYYNGPQWGIFFLSRKWKKNGCRYLMGTNFMHRVIKPVINSTVAPPSVNNSCQEICSSEM